VIFSWSHWHSIHRISTEDGKIENGVIQRVNMNWKFGIQIRIWHFNWATNSPSHLRGFQLIETQF